STIANNHGLGTSDESGITVVGSFIGSFHLSLESSTLSGNTVGHGQAADIYVAAHDHADQTITLHNTILNSAASNPVGTPNVATAGTRARITSLGHNISSDASGNLAAAGDLPSTNPFLGTFGNHGGATPTFNLLFNSPAINNADPLAGAPTATPNLALFDTTGTFATPQTITMALDRLMVYNADVPVAIAGPSVTGPSALTVSGSNLLPPSGNTKQVFDFLYGGIYTISGM